MCGSLLMDLNAKCKLHLSNSNKQRYTIPISNFPNPPNKNKKIGGTQDTSSNPMLVKFEFSPLLPEHNQPGCICCLLNLCHYIKRCIFYMCTIIRRGLVWLLRGVFNLCYCIKKWIICIFNILRSAFVWLLRILCPCFGTVANYILGFYYFIKICWCCICLALNNPSKSIQVEPSECNRAPQKVNIHSAPSISTTNNNSDASVIHINSHVRQLRAVIWDYQVDVTFQLPSSYLANLVTPLNSMLTNSDLKIQFVPLYVTHKPWQEMQKDDVVIIFIPLPRSGKERCNASQVLSLLNVTGLSSQYVFVISVWPSYVPIDDSDVNVASFEFHPDTSSFAPRGVVGSAGEQYFVKHYPNFLGYLDISMPCSDPSTNDPCALSQTQISLNTRMLEYMMQSLQKRVDLISVEAKPEVGQCVI